MASAETINVEFDTSSTSRKPEGKSTTTSSAGTGSLWERVRHQLDPVNHSLCENVTASLVFVMFILIIALAATHGGGSKTDVTVANSCQSQLCLLRSASTLSFANLSASPCDDFYKYACGLAQYALRIGPSLLERTVSGEVSRENDDRLEAILRSPVVRNTSTSYERKMKTFFSTCVNDFMTEQIRGLPLALYMSKDLYLMNASTVDRFDLNDMLIKAYTIYGSDVFFEYFITDNFLDDNKYTISINKGGIEMPVSSYLADSATAAKHREAYRTFIRTVASFLVGDANPDSVAPGSASRIEEFVSDVLSVEMALAKISQDSVGPDPGKPPLDPNNMPTLQQMDYTYPPISWSRFFDESFRPNAPDTTRVAVQDPDYLKKVSDYITQLRNSNIGEYKRKLSNYLNWRVISRHASDLSSGYVHARRQFQAVLSTRSQVYESRFDYCFRKARQFMQLGVSALFVADHVSDSSKRAVDNMYRSIQRELTAGVDRLSWIDAAARGKSKEKIGAVEDRIGYSPTETEDAYLDAYYEILSADSNDHLLDMTVSWENFRRMNQGNLLGKKPDSSQWDGATYDTNLFMNNEKVRLTVPAGILQWPFYTNGLPGYINYATLGQKIAAELVKSIDATGQLFDKDGKTNPSWSSQTTINYVQRATCLNQTFSAMRAGPYATTSGSQYVNIDKIISRHLRNLIAGADGLRLALRTYNGLVDRGADAPLPLAQLQSSQTFFVAWAQNHCYNRDPDYSVTRIETLRNMPEEVLVNGILRTMGEFAQTFKCPRGSNMVRPAGPCDGLFYI